MIIMQERFFKHLGGWHYQRKYWNPVYDEIIQLGQKCHIFKTYFVNYAFDF